ncbi:MAG TPA: hypothetical protein VMV81_13085, partial [Phycisphaerae bacterium]|nr:hypothetical protein [Phycisphaerae bacterium]
MLPRTHAALAVIVIVASSASAQPYGWTNVSPAPPPRTSSAMVYDSMRHVSVLFGGETGSPNGETWEWDGATWFLRSTTGPSPRFYHAMAFDSIRGVTVLFGGTVFDDYDYVRTNETWEWNGSVWNLRALGGPGPRDGHALAYDSRRGVTVLFGGNTYDGSQGDTWEWDGSIWELRASSGPSPRYRHSMTFDVTQGATVLFGGYSDDFAKGDTWTWDGVAWTQLSNAGPAPRLETTMAYDLQHSRTLLFGGVSSSYPVTTYGDTWAWDGSSWSQLASTGPSPRSSAAMSFDIDRSVAVLDSGASSGPNGETWEWNGLTWTIRAISGPSSRFAHALAIDNQRNVAVLFGGYSASGSNFYNSETWEWNGAAWTRRSTVGPSRRAWSGMAYDGDRGVTVLFGGAYFGGYDDTWLYND